MSDKYGLPSLPPGYYFKVQIGNIVTRYYLHSESHKEYGVTVKLRKQRKWWVDKTINTCSLDVVPVIDDKNMRSTIYVLAVRCKNSFERKTKREEQQLSHQKYVGNYPPKVL